jgi:predicted ATP-grasp superfamily ATP-dependent carboligase
MLVPTSDSALSTISDFYDELSQVTHVSCPPPAIVERVLRKDLTLELARSVGIEVPTSFEIENLASLNAQREKLKFPIVAKGASKQNIALNTFKVRYYQSFEELSAEFESDPEIGRRNLL